MTRQHMWRIGKVLLITIAMVYGTAWGVRRLMTKELCTHDIVTIRGPAGAVYDAVMDDKACSGFGGTETLTIALHSRTPAGKDIALFEYSPTDGLPLVRWENADDLSISVDRIERKYIRTQLSKFENVKVNYRFGVVD